jgi:SNF2 family DNA or RNA helicase
MRDHHLFWRSKMTAIQLSPPPYGAKIEAAIKILRTVRRKGDQAILFVQFRTQLDELRIALQDVDINAAIIQGQSAQREIEAFRDPSRTGEELKTVIVLDSSAETAVGLNLQNANHVIFLSPLLRDQQYAYDATRTQAIGRARRPGQKKLIHVYHIFALGTIDVDVLEHRERRIDALTEQGAPEVAMPTVIRELIDEVGGDMKRARTDLVDKDENFSLRTQLVCEDGRFSLRPKSWLICAGAKTQANEEDTLRRKGRNRVPGWEDFSSLVKFSSRFTEDDD